MRFTVTVFGARVGSSAGGDMGPWPESTWDPVVSPPTPKSSGLKPPLFGIDGLAPTSSNCSTTPRL